MNNDYSSYFVPLISTSESFSSSICHEIGAGLSSLQHEGVDIKYLKAFVNKWQ